MYYGPPKEKLDSCFSVSELFNVICFHRFRLIFYVRKITLNVDQQMYGIYSHFEKLVHITHLFELVCNMAY